MDKYVTTHFKVLRKIQELHVSGLQIELHKIFMHQNGGEEMFFKEHERVIGFSFNQLGNRVVRNRC
jgi:hypothetical protein